MKVLTIHFVGGTKRRIPGITEGQYDSVLGNILDGNYLTNIETMSGAVVAVVSDKVAWLELREVEE